MHLGESLAWLTRKPLNCPLQVELRHCGEDWDSNNSLGATILETQQDFDCKQTVCFGLHAEHGDPTGIASKNIEACTDWCSPLLSFWDCLTLRVINTHQRLFGVPLKTWNVSVILQLQGLFPEVSPLPASHSTPPHHHARHYPVSLMIKHASVQFGGSKVRASRELVICGRSIRSSLLTDT